MSDCPPAPRAPLPRDFYARSSLDVAPDLLDCILVSISALGVTAGRIAETEAYTPDDAASHAFRGRTRRNEVMFGPPGHAYVYFTYGMHFCLNAVTGSVGEGEAVLIRAIEPLCGTELMWLRRGLSVGLPISDDRSALRAGRLLGGGPAKLCQSLGISSEHNGVDLTMGSELGIYPPACLAQTVSDCERSILTTPRIGITKAVELKRRFTIASDKYTSRTSKT
jgi:DNA-3-methyladenine glycosylase